MNQTGPKILIVDDSSTNLKLLGNGLKNKNFNVLTALDGEQALALIENKNPELVLLDVMMPGVDGFEVCERLKNSGQLQNIPIIFITASGEFETMKKCFDLGAADFLRKPVNLDELVLKINHHLKIQQQINTTSNKKKLSGRVLVVEDNELNQEYLKSLLQNLELSYEIEMDADAAIERALRESFDFILMDVNLSGRSGLEATEILRKKHHYKNTIIAVSGHSEQDFIDKCLKSGFNDYLKKPYSAKDLEFVLLKHAVINSSISLPINTNLKSKKEKYHFIKAIELADGNNELLVKWFGNFLALINSAKIRVRDFKTKKEYARGVKEFHDLLNYASYFQISEIVTLITSLQNLNEAERSLEKVSSLLNELEIELSSAAEYYSAQFKLIN